MPSRISTAHRRAARQSSTQRPKASRPQKTPAAKPASHPALSPEPRRHDASVASTPAEKTALVSAPPPLELSGKPLDLSKEKTITVKEAAFRLRKSEDTIYVWLRSGRLKGWQPGGQRCAILVAEASVEEALLCSLGLAGKRFAAEASHPLPVQRRQATA